MFLHAIFYDNSVQQHTTLDAINSCLSVFLSAPLAHLHSPGYICPDRHKGSAVSAGAGNDYQKDKQFKKLNAQKDKLEVKVVRDGEQTLVENTEIVVGDLLLLDTGDKIVADGVLAKGFNLVVDEAALTGESEPLNKGDEDLWCMSGSEVNSLPMPAHTVFVSTVVDMVS